MNKYNLDNLNTDYDYVLVDKNEHKSLSKKIKLDKYIYNELDRCIYSVSLDDYLIKIGRINYLDYDKHIKKFNELYKYNKISNYGSIYKSFDFVSSYLKQKELYVVINDYLYEIDGNNTLEKILIILNNSKDKIEDNNNYINKYIYYLTDKVNEYERKLKKGEK